jgi:hypothetical protein
MSQGNTGFQPASSIDEVLARMSRINSALPQHDGVAYFNSLYMRVTEQVRELEREAAFEDGSFLEHLDVIFANQFFRAFFDWEESGDCHVVWRPLFQERNRPRTAPIQFALAGMNAHINHDLPLAVNDTCRRFGVEPRNETPVQRDYVRVNEILHVIEQRIKKWFLTGAMGRLDETFGAVDDAIAMWSLRTAREIAWEHAQTLWELRRHERLRSMYEHTLARSVEMASRGILI